MYLHIHPFILYATNITLSLHLNPFILYLNPLVLYMPPTSPFILYATCKHQIQNTDTTTLRPRLN